MSEGARVSIAGLRSFNLVMGVFHLLQGVLILLLSNDFSLPVASSFQVFDPALSRLVPVHDTIARLQVGPMVAAFLFLSALAHFSVSAPGAFAWYARNLKKGINHARWMEYSLSASLMIVIIAMLVGIYEIASLILIFALNATMILFGWMMELHNQYTRETSWVPYCSAYSPGWCHGSP